MQIKANKEAGFSLLEILAVVAVILIIAAIGIPQIIGLRNKAKNRSCEALYHELDSEIANALDNLIWSSTEVISIVLNNHTEETNPRDKSEWAFVTNDANVTDAPPQYIGDGTIPYSCQVNFANGGPLTVIVAQAASEADQGGGERTFRVGLTD